MSVADQQKQIAQAEEMFGDRMHRTDFAKGFYFGQVKDGRLPAYPDIESDIEATRIAEELRAYCRDHLDAARIDREATIPDEVVRGLGRLGVLGACLPRSSGGRDMTQVGYCRLMEILGAHCGSTALFVNAHHSIGPRSIVLFGTPQQQKKYLPKLATGAWLSAFALTEPEAGSDASNVQTRAEPSPDGKGFVLNGQKRYITNGAIAQVLAVMARTPVEDSDETKVTAFIVTPDMPGFEVVEPRMDKCGVRGTATARLAFRDMFVPRENVLGEMGKGLRIALTVLDFGRTTFGASCTGAAKLCLERASEYAKTRIQFGQPIGSFELVKQKLADMAAGALAMEAATYQTAALIDSGAEEYMLETAMLKVYSTEVLWQIVNDTIQIFGGKAYFADEPYERMMRDARINQIGEGANDVLRVFIALVGMRDVGLELKGVADAMSNPLGNFGKIGQFATRRIGAMLTAPLVEVRNAELEDDAVRLGRLVGMFGSHVERLLRRYQEGVLERQYLLGRVADAACELYTSSCVISRLERLLRDTRIEGAERRRELTLSRYYLNSAARRVRRNLADLWDNEDEATTEVADLVMGD